MATKTKALPKKPATVVEQISELVDKHIDTVEAIMQEYSWLSDVGMDTELRAANEKLKEFSEGLEESKELEFKALLQKLRDHEDFDANEVFESLDIDDISHENCMEILKSLDHEDVEEWAKENNYAAVKLNNMLDRDNLETFLKTEIYPNYTDQESFLII